MPRELMMLGHYRLILALSVANVLCCTGHGATPAYETVLIDGVPQNFTARPNSTEFLLSLQRFCGHHLLDKESCSQLGDRMMTKWIPPLQIVSPPDLSVVTVPTGVSQKLSVVVAFAGSVILPNSLLVCIRIRIDKGEYITSPNLSLGDFTSTTSHHYGPVLAPHLDSLQ